MISQDWVCPRRQRFLLVLAIFFVCIQGVYLADDSENGASSTDIPEESADSSSNKTIEDEHPVVEGLLKINEKMKNVSPAPNSDKGSGVHSNSHEMGKAFAGKMFPHLPELKTEISKSPEDETTASELETTAFSATEGGEKTSEESVTQPSASAEKPPEHTFAVWDANGKICSLAKLDAAFVITAITKVTLHLPKNATVEGTCEESETDMKFSWAKFNFVMSFSKIRTDDVDEWALTTLKLQYHHKSIFPGAAGGYSTLETKDLKHFKTSIGRSYFCPTAEVIHMYGEHGSSKVEAAVSMKEIQLQPFDVKDGEFSKAQSCHHVTIGGPEEPVIQNETVPLAVGLTLSILTLVVVLGFSIHRAYTMRKVDYNSME